MKTIKISEDLLKYIINAIDTDGYNITAETDKEKLQFLSDTFKKEYSNNLKYYGNNPQKTFTEWIKGLPSSFNIEFRNHAILELSYLFGLMNATATDEQEDKMIEEWFTVIYVGTQFLMKQHQISLF